MALVTVIVGSLLTALLGNRLVQRWQQRNWLQQQRLLKAQQQLGELQKVIDEVMALANARYYRTRKLSWQLGIADDARIEDLRRDYENSVNAWNEKFTAFQVQLTVYGTFESATNLLEDDVQMKFINISARLDPYLRKGADLSGFRRVRLSLEGEFTALSAAMFRTFRALANELKEKVNLTYFGKSVPFSEDTLETFSTSYLLKALFKSSNPPQAVIGPVSNSSIPTVFRL